VPLPVSKLGFCTGTIMGTAAEANGALRPMAAMAKPQSLRMGRRFHGLVVWPGGALAGWCVILAVFMVVFGNYFLGFRLGLGQKEKIGVLSSR